MRTTDHKTTAGLKGSDSQILKTTHAVIKGHFLFLPPLTVGCFEKEIGNLFEPFDHPLFRFIIRMSSCLHYIR